MLKADSKPRIILFNPRSMRAIGEDSVPPMGLLMAAINLHKKFNIAVVDQRIERDWKKRLSSLLRDNPVCLGVTALTGKQIYGGLLASRMAKDKLCPVVWGGIHASLMPQQTLKHPLVDYVVEGEGEESFSELADAIYKKMPAGHIPGVWRKENGGPTFGGERRLLNLDALPDVPYELIDLKSYIKPSPYGKTMILYTSRGCPQRCTFCFNKSFNKSCWRGFSSKRVLEDIRRIKEDYPFVEHFEFWDDNFFVNLKRSREIAEGMKRISPAITWSVLGTHVRDIMKMDDGYLGALRKSGLKEVFTGVESGSQKIVDLVRKNFTVEELFTANKRLAVHGIRPTYSFISGVPGEEDRDIKETIGVMFRLKEENPKAVLGNVKPVMCYPGTELYKIALELGFNPPKHLEGWGKFVWGNYLNLKIPWVSRKRRWFLARLYYYTVLMCPEYLFVRSKIFKFISLLLYRIARWRVKRLCFIFPVEARLMYIGQKFIL